MVAAADAAAEADGAASVREEMTTMNVRLRLATCLVLACGCARAWKTKSFDTPDQAMYALAGVIGTGNTPEAEEILGVGGPELLRSGDEVADRADAEHVQESIRERLTFENHGADTKVALIGREAWPFPIPLVKDDGRWRFDLAAGVEEVANRRVGRNELSTIATLHAYVDAQHEYVSVGRDGLPPAYASKVLSTPGKHDGLHWETAEGEPESPLGPLVAAATEEGYLAEGGEGGNPYHGYRFRLLTRQGVNAPGGAKDYVDEKGLMTRGFAMLAWPAKYESSGVMTFVVGPQGIVFQKDLGPDTDKAVTSVSAFDPDESWDPTGD